MKIRNLFFVGIAAIALAACGERIEVKPAEVGVILDSNGYVLAAGDDFIKPSKRRLPVCWPWEHCSELVRIQVSDVQKKEVMDLFMPKSNLLVEQIEVRFTASIRNDAASLRMILDRVTPQEDPNADSREKKFITLSDVYNTYVQERIRAVVRQELAKHPVEYVFANREALSAKIFNKLRAELKNAPVAITQFSLAQFNPPDVIVKAYRAAEERKIDLARVEAERDLAIKRSEAELDVAKKKAEIRLTKAEAFKREAEIMSKAVTDKWLAMRRLEVMEAMTRNKSAIFIPMNMTGKATELRMHQNLEKVANPR